MTPRSPRTLVLLGACALLTTQAHASRTALPSADSATRPNIVMVLVDDLGWQDVSHPMWSEATPFNRRYHTPNVERLARDGVTFTNAYAAAPVCTPTRTSFMTGKSPARTRITYWTLHKDKDTSRQRPDIAAPAWRMNGLNAADVTLPKLLRTVGYTTIHVGKAHFGAHDTSGADPRNLGFDVNIAGHASGGPASYYGEHAFSSAGKTGKKDAQTVWDIPGLGAYHGKDVFLTEALTTETLKAIRSAHAAERPFFLNFCPYAVHAPIMANEKLLERYGDIDPREASYATMIESVDIALGAILDELESLGIAEETLVVFTSDNGGLSAHARGGEKHTHNAPLRSGKGSAYEGGTRVATVVRWPGRTEPNTRNATPVITADFFTTLLGAAQVRIPDQHRATLDGLDLAAVIDAPDRALEDRVLGWHQPHQWGASGPGIEPFTSIRHGDWKLIYFHAKRNFELYDLATDIGETTDRSAEDPARTRELAGRMQTWIEANGAQLSVDKETGSAIPGPANVWKD